MRGPVALCLTLALAALSGCVELVEGDADAQAAADEADRLLDEYNEKAGHIAGTVTGSDGLLLEGAVVDLLTVQSGKSDEQGRFTFLDLAPGVYTLVVSAPDHLESRTDIEVAAGQFARPSVALAAVPAPTPYYTVYSMHAYAEPAASFFGFTQCYSCSLEGTFDSEGLTEVLVEAELGEYQDPFFQSSSFMWSLETCGEECSYAGDYRESPMRASVTEDLAPLAEHFHLMVEPQADFLVHSGQEFTAYLTAFYFGGAPEDFSAFLLEEEP